MNSGENEYDPLEAGLGAMRRGLGACPNAETLAGFAAESLPPGEAARIRMHVSACGVCDGVVESLREFDDPVSEAATDWAATERRLRARAFPKPPRRLWLLHPAVAYGVALAAVIVAVVGVRRPVPATVAVPSAIEMQSLRVIDLNTTRGVDAPNVTLGSGDRLVLLSFLIDIRPGFRYEASLDGGMAKAVQSSDGKGNFTVLVRRDVLSPGAHRLRVTEINPASGKVERPFDFPFQL